MGWGVEKEDDHGAKARSFSLLPNIKTISEDFNRLLCLLGVDGEEKDGKASTYAPETLLELQLLYFLFS